MARQTADGRAEPIPRATTMVGVSERDARGCELQPPSQPQSRLWARVRSVVADRLGKLRRHGKMEERIRGTRHPLTGGNVGGPNSVATALNLVELRTFPPCGPSYVDSDPTWPNSGQVLPTPTKSWLRLNLSRLRAILARCWPEKTRIRPSLGRFHPDATMHLRGPVGGPCQSDAPNDPAITTAASVGPTATPTAPARAPPSGKRSKSCAVSFVTTCTRHPRQEVTTRPARKSDPQGGPRELLLAASRALTHLTSPVVAQSGLPASQNRWAMSKAQVNSAMQVGRIASSARFVCRTLPTFAL